MAITRSVFMSYSHDSAEHVERVRLLTARLRRDGVDAIFDGYVQSPAEGWPKWMERQLERATYVVVVCSAGYRQKVSGRLRRGRGRGVRWESLLAYQRIYEADSENRRLLPVVFSKDDIPCVPGPLKASTIYVLNSEEGFEDLYRRITDQPRVAKPPLGELVAMKASEENEPSVVAEEVRRDGEGSGSMLTGQALAEIELTINVPFSSFSQEKQDALMEACRRLLDVDGVRITRKREGSTILTLSLAPEAAEKLLWAVKSGALADFAVLDASLVDLVETGARSQEHLSHEARLLSTIDAESKRISFDLERRGERLDQAVSDARGDLGRRTSARAQQELWNAFFEEMRVRARRQLGGLPRGAEDEEDIASSTLNSLLVHLQDHKQPWVMNARDAKAFLVSALQNRVLDAWRRERAKERRGERVVSSDDPRVHASSATDRRLPADVATEMADEYERLRAALTFQERRVLELDLTGLSASEVAEILGLSTRAILSTRASYRKRARALRDRVEEGGK